MIRALADEGKAVIVISSELAELLAVGDRILVLRDGPCRARASTARTSQSEQSSIGSSRGLT